MSTAPATPSEVPPYQTQSLIDHDAFGHSLLGAQVRCAQALGSEIYVGCSNGELIRFALQADDPNQLEAYRVLSQQSLPNGKPIDEIVLIPSISRALVLSDRQIHFYTLPSLDPVPHTLIKPIRNVVTFAVDEQHLNRPDPSLLNPGAPVEDVEFCVIKRNNVALFRLREKLFYQKEIPFQQGAVVARRFGHTLCLADHEFYSIVDLERTSLFQLLPVSQAPEPPLTPLQPSITVVTDNEFLILSWDGSGTMGVFITGDGEPVRGTLQWPGYPQSICLDYPYVAALLPNGTIEIHSVETQTIAQVIPLPPSPSSDHTPPSHWLQLASCLKGYLVPSTQRSEKMKPTSVRLLRE
ncbi:hypothetical protein HGRIS_011374 [Hohenbuehelia grisea]|uniref:CNH domain-containing protein n=1 Tax=Hohenbuehelia grisea TaxID=104357 RepID=A0ABR3JUV6_9AGAR